MLDVGEVTEAVETVDGLVEVLADLVEFFLELEHVGEVVVDGLVAVAFDDGFTQEDFAAVFAEGGGGGLTGEGVELGVFGFGHPDGEPFGAFGLECFHDLLY